MSLPVSPPHCPSWHCHLLSTCPGQAGGWDHAGTCGPHAGSQILPAAQAGGCRSLLVASPGWWLPTQGEGLDVIPGGRTASPPPAHTSGSLHCVRMGCLGCLVPLGVTNQPKTHQSPPFPSCSCCGSGRILATLLGTQGPDGLMPMVVLPLRGGVREGFAPGKQQKPMEGTLPVCTNC